MKKYIALLLALVLTLALLTSCELMAPGPTERPAIGQTERPSSGSAEPTGSADPGPSQILWQEGVGPDFDRRFSQIGSNVCSTENTVYFSYLMGVDLIYFADKTTGICLPLCGKPECTHDGENCNAYIGRGLHGLTCYDGRLYWVGEDRFMGNWHIFSMAYDGTDRRMGRELSDWGSCLQAQFHKGYLYRSYYAQEVVNGVAKDTLYVSAYPMEGDGEGIVILSEEIDYQQLAIQAYGDALYIAFEMENGTFALYRWSTRVGELETLFRETVPFNWNRQLWVTEDGVILDGSVPTGPDGDPWASRENNIYLFSFDSSKIELLYQYWSGEEDGMNVIFGDGAVIANWMPEPGRLRVLVRDFGGQPLLDETFEAGDWYYAPPVRNGPMTGFGMDESYLYFFKYGEKFISVAWDGSEIKLLWSRGSEYS